MQGLIHTCTLKPYNTLNQIHLQNIYACHIPKGLPDAVLQYVTSHTLKPTTYLPQEWIINTVFQK